MSKKAKSYKIYIESNITLIFFMVLSASKTIIHITQLKIRLNK